MEMLVLYRLQMSGFFVPDPVSLETHPGESFEVSAVIARERERLSGPGPGGEVKGCRNADFILVQIMRLGTCCLRQEFQRFCFHPQASADLPRCPVLFISTSSPLILLFLSY